MSSVHSVLAFFLFSSSSSSLSKLFYVSLCHSYGCQNKKYSKDDKIIATIITTKKSEIYKSVLKNTQRPVSADNLLQSVNQKCDCVYIIIHMNIDCGFEFMSPKCFFKFIFCPVNKVFV